MPKSFKEFIQSRGDLTEMMRDATQLMKAGNIKVPAHQNAIAFMQNAKFKEIEYDPVKETATAKFKEYKIDINFVNMDAYFRITSSKDRAFTINLLVKNNKKEVIFTLKNLLEILHKS